MVNEGKDGKWHMLKAFLKLHHEQWQQLEVSRKKIFYGIFVIFLNYRNKIRGERIFFKVFIW